MATLLPTFSDTYRYICNAIDFKIVQITKGYIGAGGWLAGQNEFTSTFWGQNGTRFAR